MAASTSGPSKILFPDAVAGALPRLPPSLVSKVPTMPKRLSTETLVAATRAALDFSSSHAYLGNAPAEGSDLNFLFAAPWSHSLKVPTKAVGRTEVTFRRPTSGGNEIVILVDEAPFLWWIARDGVIIDEGGSTDTLAAAVTQAEAAAAALERDDTCNTLADTGGYTDVPFGNEDRELGRQIYDEALYGRRGFRDDQLGIEDEEVWAEIFEHIGSAAREAFAREAIQKKAADRD